MCIYEECKVVTWGDPGDGGDSGAVADMLASGVTPICSCARAFAAVKDRGGDLQKRGFPMKDNMFKLQP